MSSSSNNNADIADLRQILQNCSPSKHREIRQMMESILRRPSTTTGGVPVNQPSDSDYHRQGTHVNHQYTSMQPQQSHQQHHHQFMSQPMGMSQPIVMSHPMVMGMSQPVAMGMSHPMAMGMSQPMAMGMSQPTMTGFQPPQHTTFVPANQNAFPQQMNNWVSSSVPSFQQVLNPQAATIQPQQHHLFSTNQVIPNSLSTPWTSGNNVGYQVFSQSTGVPNHMTSFGVSQHHGVIPPQHHASANTANPVFSNGMPATQYTMPRSGMQMQVSLFDDMLWSYSFLFSHIIAFCFLTFQIQNTGGVPPYHQPNNERRPVSLDTPSPVLINYLPHI